MGNVCCCFQKQVHLLLQTEAYDSAQSCENNAFHDDNDIFAITSVDHFRNSAGAEVSTVDNAQNNAFGRDHSTSTWNEISGRVLDTAVIPSRVNRNSLSSRSLPQAFNREINIPKKPTVQISSINNDANKSQTSTKPTTSTSTIEEPQSSELRQTHAGRSNYLILQTEAYEFPQSCENNSFNDIFTITSVDNFRNSICTEVSAVDNAQNNAFGRDNSTSTWNEISGRVSDTAVIPSRVNRNSLSRRSLPQAFNREITISKKPTVSVSTISNDTNISRASIKPTTSTSTIEMPQSSRLRQAHAGVSNENEQLSNENYTTQEYDKIVMNIGGFQDDENTNSFFDTSADNLTDLLMPIVVPPKFNKNSTSLFPQSNTKIYQLNVKPAALVPSSSNDITKSASIQSTTNVGELRPVEQCSGFKEIQVEMRDQMDQLLNTNLDHRRQEVIKNFRNLIISNIPPQIVEKNPDILNRLFTASNSRFNKILEINKVFKLELLDKDSCEFRKVNKKFFKTNKRCFKIHSIEKVYNPYIMMQYVLKKIEYIKKGILFEEKMMFHGTKKSKVDNICEINFNWRLTVQSKFGSGVNFSPISNYSTHYGDTSYNKVMIASSVIIGNCCNGTRNMKIPPLRFDTSVNDKKSVYVKYDDNTFYPSYLIHYGGFDDQINNKKKNNIMKRSVKN